jgi:hypothetical protein
MNFFDALLKGCLIQYLIKVVFNKVGLTNFVELNQTLEIQELLWRNPIPF